MDTERVGSQLNTLLTRNYDAEKGYEQLSEKIEQQEMQNFFKKNYQERFRFGHEIKDILNSYDIEPNKGTSTKGDLHRTWINLKDTLAQNSNKAVLEEAERGESKAIEDYQDAVANPDFKPEHREILSNHLTSIKKSKEMIDKLKETV